MPVRIASVDPGSIAARLGWAAGDQVLAVNGEAVEDELDFRFKTTEERLVLRVRRGGRMEEQTVSKEPDESLGADLEEFRIKTCGDDCVFCFVDQNPVGLRDTLYFRDGDFRMSFLYGNYITMTNLRERDIARIVEQRLSPMYVSIHATDDAARAKMMGHRTIRDKAMEKLRFLAAQGIELHAQIVLVPGHNDAGQLVRTVLELGEMHERLTSLTIVPIGLTRHRRDLADLRLVTSVESQMLVRQVARWQAHFRETLGRGFVYLSDEVYLTAGLGLPARGLLRRLPADGERRRHEPRLPQRARLPGRRVSRGAARARAASRWRRACSRRRCSRRTCGPSSKASAGSRCRSSPARTRSSATR